MTPSADTLIGQVAAKIASGEWRIEDNVILYEPEDTWHADDGNAEVVFTDCPNGKAAARRYTSEGDWGNDTETVWVGVHVWQNGLDADGDDCQVNADSHTITLDPDEPECTEDEHDWQQPHELLGGLQDNPGVWGHGGGVICHSICMNCGTEMITDSWAQDPDNGQQGLHSVRYEEGKWSEEVEAMREEEVEEEA